MADVRAIYAVGSSLVRWLNRAYEGFAWPTPGPEKPSCSFQLAGSNELIGTPTFKPGVVFFLYRVIPNEHVRRTLRDNGPNRGRASFAVDLHYLAIPWIEGARDEALLLGWTMRMLESHPVLGPGDLGDAAFAEDESVQIVIGEISNEDLMRIWDAIEPPYRLSVPYIARVVQIDLEQPPEPKPVVAKKLVFEQIKGPGSGEQP